MSIPTEVIMRMATLGLSEEQAKAVADMLTTVETATAETVSASYEERIEESREKGRERWRKWKTTHPTNVSKREPTLANGSKQLVGGDAPVEDKTSKLDIEPQEKKQNTAARGVAEFKAKLSPTLDPDLLDAFVAVRKAKRGAMTGYAADLFVGDAEKCGMSVPEAAKECVRSSWITVKPEYFAGRPRASPPLGKPRSVLDAVNALNTRLEQASANSAETIQGTGAVVFRLPAAQQR